MKKASIKNIFISLILIISFALVSGCGLVTDVETPSTSGTETTENVTPIDSDWTVTTVESQTPVLPSIADVVARVKPSVVAITSEVVITDIFNRRSIQEGAGSGWIISTDGIIVTNNHVVEGAETITVTLDDGRTFSVDINTVATDKLTDLAVLKIDAENLPAATVGDSRKLRVGDWVVAIGNSLGERISATNGIVSALEVSLPMSSDQTLYNLIQTDAAINPGNSGGPLVNMAGEVVGITSAKIAEVGVEGMGYAISSQEAAPVIEQLINTGYVIRPWLGVSLWPVDQYVIQRYNLAVDKGAFVVYVAAGSPADEAGLKPGDVITGFAFEETDTVDDLIQAIRAGQIGQDVEITYWRGENTGTTHATLIESPPS
jgi:serine protease Do